MLRVPNGIFLYKSLALSKRNSIEQSKGFSHLKAQLIYFCFGMFLTLYLLLYNLYEIAKDRMLCINYKE